MPKSQPETRAKLLAGKYRLGCLLGEGGMGAVYEAEHIGLRATVAVKILGDGDTLDSAALARFRREAHAMGAIRHDNVVAVMDVDIDDGTPFLVMERLDGESLSSVLRRERVLTPEAASGILLQVLAGLAAAHARGVIHRDLKPGNIFIARQSDGEKRVKILDFGVSKLGGPEQAGNVTADGVMIGTPNFMAPEQVEGRHDIDGRADLYAAGVILYRAVTGHLPFAATDSAELYQSITRGEARPPREHRPEIPPGLENVILKAMQPNRDLRYRDAHAFRVALEEAMPEQSMDGLFFTTRTDLAPPAFVPTPKVEDGDATMPARPSALARLRAATDGRPSWWRYVVATPLLLALLAVLFWASRSNHGEAALLPPIKIGVIRYLPTDLVDKQHRPLADYLSQELHRDVELVIADDHDQLAELFLRGDVSLAAMSPYNYVRTRAQDPSTHLLASPVLGGGANSYEGLILTRSDASIDSLSELKGKVFCFVDPGSSSGYLYPRAVLQRAGLDPDRDFKAVRFGGNHLTTLRLLARGQCDAAAVYASILYDARQHQMAPEMFRVLASTHRIPVDAYCSPGSTDPKLVNQLRHALLKLSPSSEAAEKISGASDAWMFGFTEAFDQDYESVRDLMKTVQPDALFAPPDAKHL
jgi:serine/threonine-protein kinase